MRVLIELLPIESEIPFVISAAEGTQSVREWTYEVFGESILVKRIRDMEAPRIMKKR
jgi:hypothetical protein